MVIVSLKYATIYFAIYTSRYIPQVHHIPTPNTSYKYFHSFSSVHFIRLYMYFYFIFPYFKSIKFLIYYLSVSILQLFKYVNYKNRLFFQIKFKCILVCSVVRPLFKAVAIAQPSGQKQKIMDPNGFDDEPPPEPRDGWLLVRIHVPELNVHKCLQFPAERLVWDVKQQVLASLPKVSTAQYTYKKINFTSFA